MKAIVTGGAGFIGSHIAKRLIKMGIEVFIIDDLSAGKVENIPKQADFACMDLLDINEEIYKDILADVNWVFHNAASKKNICLKDPARDLDVNGKGTLKLIQACVKAGVKHFVHASTGSVYGETSHTIREESPLYPVSYYGVSKLAGENYVSLFRDEIPITILRYFHVYGKRQENDPELGGVVAVFKRQIKEGGPITVHGSGFQKRVFTHVGDVVEANIMAAVLGVTGIYNCCSNVEVSINQLVAMLNEKAQVEIVHTSPLLGDIYNFDVDNGKIKAFLNMKFRAFNPFV